MISARFKFADAKGLFFDSPKVRAAMDRKSRRALGKFGAFVRTAARGLIRKRKNPAKPGSAPTNQTGRLKGSILFFADLAKRSVVIGPTLTASRGASAVGNTNVAALETGGRFQTPDGDEFDMAPRPFMGPAMESESPKFPQLFKG